MKPISVNTCDGLVIYLPKKGITIRLGRDESQAVFAKKGKEYIPGADYHPELVHINITNECTRKCDYCYVNRGEYQMPFEDFKTVVDKCVENKVFQITIGGGEPFLHKDIQRIVEYCTNKINLCTTTNGDIVLPNEVMQQFKQVNVSYHEDMENLRTTLEGLKLQGVPKLGINFIYNKATMHLVEQVHDLAFGLDAELLLLQYKPIREQDWSLYIGPEETFKVAKELAGQRKVSIAVDGAMCLKCEQKKKFMTIGVKGEVYPCSFIHEPNMGNLITGNFQSIWKNRGEVITCPYLAKEDQLKLKQ